MESLVDVGLRNAALAIPLALLALLAGRIMRRPAALHVLWVLVLLRLVMPALWDVEVPRPESIGRSIGINAAAGEGRPAADRATETPSRAIVAGGAKAALETVEGPLATSPAETLPAADVAFRSETPEPASSEAALAMKADQPTAMMGVRNLVALNSWRAVVGTGWLLGSVVISSVMCIQMVRFGRALHRSRIASESIQFQAKRVGRMLGMRRTPRVILVDARVSPMLCGIFGRPCLVLPARLWSKLDLGQRLALLAHEIAHYGRGDHWVRTLELPATILFWWHPILWLAKRQLRETEEQCCDAWVVWALPERRRDYATAIVDTVGFLSEGRTKLPALASGVGQVRHLKRRLAMIMQGAAPRRLPRLALAALLASGLTFATLGTTWADDRTPQNPLRGGDDQLLPPDPTSRPRGDGGVQFTDPRPEQPVPADQEAIRRELEQARADFERARRHLEDLERRLGLRRDAQPRTARNVPAARDGLPAPDRLPDRAPAGGTDQPLPRGTAMPRANSLPPERAARDAQPGLLGDPASDRGSLEQRMQMLERQLREMVRQMEQMHRDMDRGAGGRGSAEPSRQTPSGSDRSQGEGSRGRTADSNVDRGSNPRLENGSSSNSRDSAANPLGR